MTTASLLSPRPSGNGKPRATPAHHPSCIDLTERFGNRFKVEYEESYYAQYGAHARVDDHWLKILPCRAGHICPWGGTKLAAVTDRLGAVVRKLAALPGAKLHQHGSDGAIILFDVACFPEVAKVMRPIRRRRMSPEQRARLSEAGAKYRFGHGAQCDSEVRPCVPMGLAGSEANPPKSAVSIPSSNSL